jgi:hypothetical protein
MSNNTPAGHDPGKPGCTGGRAHITAHGGLGGLSPRATVACRQAKPVSGFQDPSAPASHADGWPGSTWLRGTPFASVPFAVCTRSVHTLRRAGAACRQVDPAYGLLFPGSVFTVQFSYFTLYYLCCKCNIAPLYYGFLRVRHALSSFK